MLDEKTSPLNSPKESPQNVGSVAPSVTEDTAPLSKKKAKKAKKVTQKIKMVPGSVDAMVQHTNDDSVVSKRSAVTHQYMQDPFLRFFVKKPSRRSPLINRGYYLRMKVIDDTITDAIRFFTEESAEPLQVISLGAGFDTFALRALLAPRVDMPSTDTVHFYDVDFPAVMQNKSALMRAAPAGTFPEAMVLQPDTPTHTVASSHYNAVGVDLREAASSLIPLLVAASSATNQTFSVEHPTIIYAECVMQYMPAADAQNLVRFIAQTFKDAVFVAYDQIHPDDSFGHVMQHALRQKSSPLLGIVERPDGRTLTQSAVEAGMACALFANFYDLSRHVIAGEEGDRVNGLEPFDELEEWAEMCEHYGITLAVTQTKSAACVRNYPAFKPVSAEPPQLPITSDERSVSASAHMWPTGRFALEGWGNGGSCVEVLSSPSEDVLIVSFGGFAVARTHERVNKVYVHSLREGELNVVPPADTASTPPALCFHTFTRIAPFRYVVFGGRTNPTDVHAEAYLLSLQVPTAVSLGCHVTTSWQRLALRTSLPGSSPPAARCRHMMCATGANTLLLIGGKSSTGHLLNDVWRAVVDVEASTIDWTALPTDSAGLPPLCSAALTFAPRQGAALLSGGLVEGSHCASAVYTVNPTTGECQAVTGVDVGGRFSHAATIVEVDGAEQLLLLGGSTCEEKETVATGVLLDLADWRLHPVSLPADCPSLSRHSCVTIARGTVATVGGGYTCFSFGTFAARPLVLRLGTDCAPWPLQSASVRDGSTTAVPGDPSIPSSLSALYTAGAPPLTYARLLCLPRPPVETQHYTPENFLAVARAASRPVVFRNVDMGRCVSQWASPEYLKDVEGTATVSVHVAEGSTVLDFVRKNFVHRHVTFAELVDHVGQATMMFRETGRVPDSTWYFRSIAAHMKSDRANLWNDFPNLGRDFELPGGAREFIMPRVHQSCLRINAAPLQLWTHYDTQDNVLCQVVGRKRVVLFPPGCHNDLYMSGSSSPVLNIDAPDLLQYPRFIEACKHATEVILEPGDMLYFPANWFHHITTLSEGDGRDASTPALAGHTISVNVFFNHFDREEYDAKDLYGNKDLPVCVEMRETIVRDAQRLLSEVRLRTDPQVPVPAEYTQFTLHQAIQDLERLLAASAAATEPALPSAPHNHQKE